MRLTDKIQKTEPDYLLFTIVFNGQMVYITRV